MLESREAWLKQQLTVILAKKKYILNFKTENILNVTASLNDQCYYHQYIISLLRHKQARLTHFRRMLHLYTP